MVSCLILYEPTMLSLTKCRMLRSMFFKRQYEIHVLENHTVLIFLWNINWEEVLQSALILETERIAVGYGWAEHKEGAELYARSKLMKRSLVITN
ncbi:hypothetical protein ACLIBH_13315 [Virgibacillus sp. W0430]|uniref:hypothetical protein n=1 Tax=Virgibacillus sp. W0430 TaxID=3391580 RepID=UPI003F48AA19